jgi:hypothetical protein
MKKEIAKVSFCLKGGWYWKKGKEKHNGKKRGDSEDLFILYLKKSHMQRTSETFIFLAPV